MDKDRSLWIAGLEPYMTEEFLRNSLSLMGEEDSVVSVKVIRNKYTGVITSHGYITFDSPSSAAMVMHKLSNKIIPNSHPPVKFQLCHASPNNGEGAYADREYSIWVSELPSNITDAEFEKIFASRYESVRTTKLIRENGESKVNGFVRFTDRSDQRDALIHMNGFNGIGSNPLKVTLAIPKTCLPNATKLAEAQSFQYAHLYENYGTDRGAWANHGSLQRPFTAKHPVIAFGATANSSNSTKYNLDWDLLGISDSSDEEETTDEKGIPSSKGSIQIEHDIPINVDAMNAEYMQRSQEVWDAVEKDRWIYNLENDEGMVPNFNKQVIQAGCKP